MKTPALLLLALSITGCHARTVQVTPQFKKAVSIVSSDTIFQTSFPKMMKQLDGLCAAGKRSDNGDENVNCTTESGIESIVFRGTGASTLVGIDTIFAGEEKCALVKLESTKKYGKATTNSGPCEAVWTLPKLKNGPERRLSLSPITPQGKAILKIEQDDEW